MGCLHCQRKLEHHTKSELVDCAEWIQDKHHIRSEKYRGLYDIITKINHDVTFRWVKKHSEKSPRPLCHECGARLRSFGVYSCYMEEKTKQVVCNHFHQTCWNRRFKHA